VGWAHRILAERDALLAGIDRMHGGLTARVRIGAIPTAIPTTPLISERFSERNPLAGVQIVTLPSREIHRGLADFELDAGVTYLDDETPPGTRRIELFRERHPLLLENMHEAAATEIVEWEAAAELPLCVLTAAMRNRRPVVGLILPERTPPTIIADALAESLRDAHYPICSTRRWRWRWDAPSRIPPRRHWSRDLASSANVPGASRQRRVHGRRRTQSRWAGRRHGRWQMRRRGRFRAGRPQRH
jgi:hypothetical protein